jgi:hypothetical protein
VESKEPIVELRWITDISANGADMPCLQFKRAGDTEWQDVKRTNIKRKHKFN